jgi:hypothetical protein
MPTLTIPTSIIDTGTADALGQRSWVQSDPETARMKACGDPMQNEAANRLCEPRR